MLFVTVLKKTAQSIFDFSKSSFGEHIFPIPDVQIYAPQTKILEDRTKCCVCVFEVLFKDVSTLFGLWTDENPFKNAHATLCSVFQHLRFGEHKFMLPKPSVGN
jgi:hypothetical protein